MASAATVGCNPASLVTALAAVSGSGNSGTVTLTAGCTYTMTAVNNTTDGPNAFPDILGHVTVVGNGATITRSGATSFRFFLVDDGGSLNLSNVNVSNGSIASGDLHGGAAILNRSLLTVTGVTFRNNNSLGSTGGGAIDNHDMGVLTVSNSTFTGNVALQGGAIEDEATLCHTTTPDCGRASVTNSTFTNNMTTQFGGGAFEGQLDGPTPAVCGPTWPQASCQEVGGAHDTLVDDTFSGNSAVTEGGGIASFGTTAVTNSTITNNSAGSGGGGGVQNTGTITIVQSTIAANTSAFGANIHSFADTTHQPGLTALTMSIVTAGVTGPNCGGTVAMTDNGYNLDSATSCGFSNHALNSTNPTLGSLASNGGPTQTMALLSGSPAIDAIPSGFAGCSGSTDQRGVNRPQGGGCDIGAFEVSAVPAPCQTPALNASPGSPSATGVSVTFTAGTSGCPNPRFRFWIQAPHGGWMIQQDYSATNTFTWTGTGLAGSYGVEVDVRDLSEGTSVSYDAVRNLTYLLNGCSAVSLSANPTSPHAPTGSVLLTANATCPGTATYRFWTKAPGGPWSVAQDYSTANTFSWSIQGVALGSYGLEVDVRNQGGTDSYEKVSNITYVVGATPCTTPTLSANPASPGATGGNVTFTATTSGCPNPRYRFWVQGLNHRWMVMQDYTATNTFIWTGTGLVGSYGIEVDVRDQTATVSYDAVKNITYTLNGCSAVSMTANPPNSTAHGNTVTFTATATCPGTAVYKFWVKAQGGSWTVVQTYGSSNTLSWVAGAAGTYSIEVDVEDNGATDTYEKVSSLVYTVT